VFGIKYPGFALPQIRLSQAERGFGKKYLRKLKGGNAGLSIIVHPGGRNPFRLWEIKNHVALCDKIIEKYQADVFIAYSEDERSFAEKIMRGSRNKLHSICIKPIRGYSSVISAGDLFISTDGGPLQIALALGVPCIGIFRRRLNAEYWYDYRSRNNLFACFVRQIRRSSAPKENIQRIMSESKKVIPREVDLVFEKVARALKRKIRA
jgi:ADP-heptose:LPS heptosyltransferase